MELCHVCQEAPAIIEPDGRVLSCKPCDEARQHDNKRRARARRFDDAQQAAGVPPMFRAARLTDFPKVYHLPVGKSLYLHGSKGVGKTHLLAGILAEGLLSPDHPLDVKFVVSVDLLAEIKDTFSPGAKQTEEQVFEKYVQAKILYLDDLGVEKSSDWVLQALYRIINHRYNWMLPTVISSNLSIEELVAKFDDRIASRSAGMCELIFMTGSNRRLQK